MGTGRCGLGAGLLALSAAALVARSAAAQGPVYAAPSGGPPPGYYVGPAAPPAPARPAEYPMSPRDYGAGPDTLTYREGMFVPPGYHLGTRPHRMLLLSGLGIFSIPYLVGLTVGTIDAFQNQKGWLVLPVVGPFITSSKRQHCAAATLTACGAGDASVSFVLTTDGILQAVGVGTMLLALAVQEDVLVRNDVSWVMTPTVGPNGPGLAALGRF